MKTHLPPRLTNRRASRSGFTLAEIIVALAIASFVLVGIGQLMMDTVRTTFITAEKLDITADVRQFTLEMAENARAANHFYIYKSFNLTDRNDEEKRLRDESTGDFLLLIFMEPYPDIDSAVHYTRFIGYFRHADPDDPESEGPVYRFERNYYPPDMTNPPAGFSGPYQQADTTSPEELIKDILASGTFPTVVQLSKGLADGQLFYNFKDRSIMVKAQIIHGNVAKRITDTYNYTVSPRG